MEQLCSQVKNSELACPKGKRTFLVYPTEGLCPCSLEVLEDGVAFHFDTEGMVLAKSIHDKSHAEQLRFLLNAAELNELHTDYAFSLALDNVLLDLNLRPWVLQRDLNCGGADFLCKYKALIGAVLAHKYEYADYLDGGEDLYKKHKLLDELSKLESVAAIRERLTEAYHAEVRLVEQSKRLVPKQNVIFSRVMLPVLTLALLIASFFAGRSLFIDIPRQEQIIAASQAYIAGDYIAAQLALRDVAPADMTFETRHFLARAYVITEALSDTEINHILMGLTRMTDVSLFDYWIYLGRLDFEEALEIARRFGDDELLLFAYLKYEAYVRADVLRPGDERTALLNYLEGQITRLRSERDIQTEE